MGREDNAMIEMENVSKHFGTVHAVNDLTLRVPAGELFCFLGPNGAGKTTTIKLLCGLLKPTEGTIRIGGLDLRAHGVEARAITGYIPDFPFMYDRLTAAEFYEFTGDLHQPVAARRLPCTTGRRSRGCRPR